MTRSLATLIAILTLAITPAFTWAQSDRTLVDRYDTLVSREKYDAALKTAQTIVERHPESSVWRFNLGSMLARTGDHDGAIEQLARCADLGYTGLRSFEESQDLDPIRDDERFTEILDKVRANAQKRFDEFVSVAKDHTPRVYVPSVKDEHPPLVIALHGTGMRGDDMIAPLRSACERLGMVLVAPDALRPASSGFAWTYRDESEWMVEHMIEWAQQEHGIDPERVYLLGFSQGANIAITLAQTHPDHFAGIVPICGHYEPNLTEADADATLPPIALISGSRDPWSKTYALAKRELSERGASVSFANVQGMGHEIPQGGSRDEILYHALKWCIDERAED
jgi:predicted esterase